MSQNTQNCEEKKMRLWDCTIRLHKLCNKVMTKLWVCRIATATKKKSIHNFFLIVAVVGNVVISYSHKFCCCGDVIEHPPTYWMQFYGVAICVIILCHKSVALSHSHIRWISKISKWTKFFLTRSPLLKTRLLDETNHPLEILNLWSNSSNSLSQPSDLL